MRNKLVCGVGITNIKCVDGTGKMKESYKRWENMLQRCYSEKLQTKCPTYIGCSVCPEWLTYSVFDSWYEQNLPKDESVKWQLDKDLLFPGNKVYCPEKCVFVPQYINSLFIDSAGGKKSNFPVGVSYTKKDSNRNAPYMSSVSNGEGKISKKYFTTSEEARLDYIIRKTEIVCKVAKKARDAGHISEELYFAIIRRPIS